MDPSVHGSQWLEITVSSSVVRIVASRLLAWPMARASQGDVPVSLAIRLKVIPIMYLCAIQSIYPLIWHFLFAVRHRLRAGCDHTALDVVLVALLGLARGRRQRCRPRAATTTAAISARISANRGFYWWWVPRATRARRQGSTRIGGSSRALGLIRGAVPKRLRALHAVAVAARVLPRFVFHWQWLGCAALLYRIAIENGLIGLGRLAGLCFQTAQ